MTKRVPGWRRMAKNGPRPVPAASATMASPLRAMLDVPSASESEKRSSGYADLLDRSEVYGGSYGSYAQASPAADYDVRPYGDYDRSGEELSTAGGRDSTSTRRDYDWSDFDARSYSSESYVSDVRRTADEASYFDSGLIDLRRLQRDYGEIRAQTRAAAPSESPDYLAVKYGLSEYSDREPETTAAKGGASGQDAPVSDPSHAVETSPPTGLSREDAHSVYDDTVDQMISPDARKRFRRRPSEADAEREPAALRLAVLLLPREARRDWQEEQRRYLLELPPGRARRAWIISLLLGLPALAFATRIRSTGGKESA